ncbi:MAG: S8/S53 family peptidase [Mycobacteriales bacterium]|nr:S8/S53 family peptidase [Mycobacteriales bacterium]
MRLLSPRIALLVAAGVLAVPALSTLQSASAAPTRPGDDAVVIAVIDSGFSPYHLDYRATQMPQAKTASKADDLPLTKAPHTWLKGFPKPGEFESYMATRLTLPKNPKADMAALQKSDADAWGDLERSTAAALNYTWMPGTKVIGAMSFASSTPLVYGTGGPEHGMGTSSVSVGNIYGSCPECLLVFLQAGAGPDYEAALSWAMAQPWIDAVSNSYGISTAPVVRDRVYNGSDVPLMKKATERGQTVFFSAGNGVTNDFITPNGTLLSSQEGPDWIVTVGATDKDDVDYTGSGKPADVASIGGLYPSAINAKDTSGSGLFGGTSNATPVVAGTYGRALWLARQALSGPSRVQGAGVIASGGKVACGPARKDCELRDGRLTRAELQNRLFLGATPTTGGFAGRRTIPGSVLGLVPVPAPVGGMAIPFVTTPPIADTRMASEGYGTYRGKIDGPATWKAEFDSRLWDVLRGTKPSPTRPAGETEWFRVDSECRQHIWGSWTQGAYVDDATTPLPSPDPMWPTRTLIQTACPALVAPPES